MDFRIQSKYKPSGSQPGAISSLVSNIKSGVKDQVLLGVTGSGKTFTIANLIEKTNKPTLVIAHNKTLAAQLTQEFREFFPENEVEYFVSYYDYYQPEAYMANTDTYIEKEATVNDEIDRLRNAATQAILTRNDVIVVASVSCIYGLGSPEFYSSITLNLKVGDKTSREELMRKLITLRYAREDIEPKRGTFRARGSLIELIPANKEVIYQIEVSDKIEQIKVMHKINRNELEELTEILIFPFGHYVWPEDLRNKALSEIEKDLEAQLKVFRKQGKILEAERLSRRTRYDMEMIKEIGYCNGIENYSRYFDERLPGQPPYTLIDYFEKSYGKDYLMVIDESHVTVPQIGGMYMGDLSRKDSLVEYGFRLPAAKDNRPLKFNEFEAKMPQTVYVSATPAKYELEKSACHSRAESEVIRHLPAGRHGREPKDSRVRGNDNCIVEQIVRPTHLIDPDVEIRQTKGQIDDLISMIEGRTKAGERTLVTSLTKKMAEDLATYLEEKSIKVRYLHSDIDTLERIQILTDLRRGEFDVLIGVNLLREGLDLPEVSLVAILDADKEGFLRSEMSLIQTIGRAARNVNGKVILYADRITGSMKRAIDETTRRRKIQLEYNEKHNVTPKSIQKEIRSIYENVKTAEFDLVEEDLSKVDMKSLIKRKETDMKQASAELRFEEAAIIRDQLIELKKAAGFFSKAR